MTERHSALITRFEEKSRSLEALLGKGPEITAEDVVQGNQLNGELETLKAEIETAQDADRLKGALAQHQGYLNAPNGGFAHPESKASVLGYARDGTTYLSTDSSGKLFKTEDGELLIDEKTLRVIGEDEYKRAFMSYLRKSRNGLTAAELKTLQEGADPSGGFLVPEDIMNRVVMKKPTPTRVTGYVTSLNTSKDALVIPRVVYTTDDVYSTGIRATWTGEVPPTSTAMRVTEPVFGQLRIPVYTSMLSMPLTNDLVEDALFPLMSWSSDRFRETIDLQYDNMIVNGSGIGQPSGILLNPGGTDQPATQNVGNPITADGVVKVAWDLPEQYDMNARWLINKTSVGQSLALLKDAQNRYLWGNGYQDSGLTPGGLGNQERVLCGYPVNFSGFMPATGSANSVAIFGDFSGYYLINRVGFSIQVLRELYAETNQVLLLGRMRFGGQVAEAWKLKVAVQS